MGLASVSQGPLAAQRETPKVVVVVFACLYAANRSIPHPSSLRLSNDAVRGRRCLMPIPDQFADAHCPPFCDLFSIRHRTLAPLILGGSLWQDDLALITYLCTVISAVMSCYGETWQQVVASSLACIAATAAYLCFSVKVRPPPSCSSIYARPTNDLRHRAAYHTGTFPSSLR